MSEPTTGAAGGDWFDGYAAAMTEARYCGSCGRHLTEWSGETSPGAPCMGCGRYPAAAAVPSPETAPTKGLHPDDLARMETHDEDRWLIDRERGGWQYATERYAAARIRAALDGADTPATDAQDANTAPGGSTCRCGERGRQNGSNTRPQWDNERGDQN